MMGLLRLNREDRPLKKTGSLGVWFIGLLLAVAGGVAQGADTLPAFLDDKAPPTFDQSRKLYLNRQARPFVNDLVCRERFLISLVDQIAAEVNARGVQGWSRSRMGFDLVYRRADSLTEAYGSELRKLLRVAGTLDSLERQALQDERMDLVWAIRDAKSQIAAAMDNSALEANEAQRRLLLLRRVQFELGELVRIYDQLEGLRRVATTLGRFDVVAEIDANQDILLQAVSTWGKTEPLDSRLVDEYIYELSRLVNVLTQLDELSERASEFSPMLESLIGEAKANILATLDPWILEAFGYSRFTRGEGVPLGELLKEWERSEWVDYQVASTFNEIIYRKLLETATPSERERMLARALEAGVQTYSSGEFALAELHLSHALETFEPYGFNLAPVHFYRGECLLALARYREALEEYQHLTKAPGVPPQYAGLASLRMISLAFLGQAVDVDEAYVSFDQNAEALSPQDGAAGHFLAGLWYLQEGRPVEAKRSLDQVSDGSPFGLQARFLRAVALARVEGYESAKRIFQELASLLDAPGRGPLEASIANASLVKLGLIAYEQGEYEQAVAYLEKVRPNLPAYEEALLGLAWSYLKLGDYQSPIPAAEEIVQRFLESEYAYEATVLAAHCKRILGRREDALEDLRYVTNARMVEDLAREWGKERLRLNRIKISLDSLEQVIIERGDQQLYPQLLEAKEQVNFALWMIENPGPAGARMLQEFNSERSRIATLISRCDRLREAAEELGRKDLVYRVDKVQHRLLRTIETYHGDLTITQVNHFIDYPLALRESTSRYVVSILDSMRRETDFEVNRLAQIKLELDSLRALAERLGRRDVAFEAEFLGNRLRGLAGDLCWTQGWIASRDARIVDADFDRWADFSGFGMSDITLTLLRDREQTMARYAELIQAIDHLLQQRREELEQSLALTNEKLRRLERELEGIRLQQVREQQQQYFEREYFDRSTTETPASGSEGASIGQPEPTGATKHATGTE